MGKWILVFELFLRSILPPFYSFSYIERVCMKKLEKRPDNGDVLWFLANYYMWHKKYEPAQGLLERLITIYPDSKSVKLLLSNAYFKLGRHSKVAQLLLGSNILSEKDKENYYLGDSLLELGNFDDAIKYLDDYVGHYPKDDIPFVRLGYAYYMKGLYEQALTTYRRAEALNPSSKEIKDSIDLCLTQIGRKEGVAP
jgi:tetratricopeptide (TPR) repeat protein